MKRPTIPDLAKATGVSVSIVKRVLNRPASVRQPTPQRVMGAAEEIGFYGLDNWKVGRTAAWAFVNIVKDPGEIGILLGSHRYRQRK